MLTRPTRDEPLDTHCPACYEVSRRTLGKVTETKTGSSIGLRAGGLTVARRRKCLRCGVQWLTYEVNETGLKIIKDYEDAKQAVEPLPDKGANG